MVGPREAGVIWSRHILNCAALVPMVGEPQPVIDVGSGAGLPGIVLALADPSRQITLVEPMARRCAFLADVVAELALDQVEIVQARAEECAGTLSAGTVVARAVAPLIRLVPMALPLVRPGGQLLAIKGAAAERELAEAADVLRRHDAQARICPVAAPGTVARTTVVRVVLTPRG
ncbi:MAG: 16S rRNA (guanine(527)-N(7))-methyltransferase RsmG [Actinomycetes bacterium]